MSPATRRMMAVALSAAAVTIVGGWPLLAQESARSKAPAPAKAGKRQVDPTRRLPNHFGQLGLSATQKESVYKIQAKHHPRIAELEKELEQLRAAMLKECEGVLTDAQRTILADRRAASTESRAKKTKDAAPARPKG